MPVRGCQHKRRWYKAERYKALRPICATRVSDTFCARPPKVSGEVLTFVPAAVFPLRSHNGRIENDAPREAATAGGSRLNRKPQAAPPDAAERPFKTV